MECSVSGILEGEIVKSGCQLWIYPPGNRKCVKPLTYPPDSGTDRPAGLPFGPYEPSRLVYVYRRGDGAGNPGTGQIYPDDYGRTDPYRFHIFCSGPPSVWTWEP